MIVTVTPNPSLDRTASLTGPIVRGQVHRFHGSTTVAAGKGVNISRALHGAGQATLAIVPAGAHDPLLTGLAAVGISFQAVGVDEPVRTNLTVTEPDGTTTKFNEPGARMNPAQRAALEDAVVAAAAGADAVVLTGSLPPGLPDDWYATMARRLKDDGALVVVDTSDAPLIALAEAFPEAAPHLMKPNSVELGQLSGADGPALEAAASAGEFAAVVAAARALIRRGVVEVMVTLGGAGALLVTADDAWHAVAAPISVRSTVGAGDSSLAGFLLARTKGLTPEQCLRAGVQWGSAAAGLPGSTLPTSDQAAAVSVTLTHL